MEPGKSSTSTPRLTPSPPKRRRTVAEGRPSPLSTADLLATFGAQRSPSSASRMAKLAETRNLRHIQTPNYAEPEDSTSPSVMGRSSAFSSPGESSRTSQIGGEEESDDELSRDTVVQVAPRRNVGYEFRKRPEPTAIHVGRKRKKMAYQRSRTILHSDTLHPPPQLGTARNLVRQGIADVVKPKRDAFLLAHRELFQPLLPETSYIDKLQRLQAMSGDDEPPFVKMTAIEKQPGRIRAVMKPYQLEGLSFLVHMYSNGMSCILGDEMGLGKTLQTLALFEHLAEARPKTDGENRPNLVVCPLSVLSSWINEAKKWAPELNVIRYHGPKAERERLKLLTQGKIDRYGNDTHLVKNKKRITRTKRGATVIDLDEPEFDERPVDLVVTTYETFKSEQAWFKKVFVWRYCVLDEGHKIKNDKSDISLALQGLRSEVRLLLTGTPLQNNLSEMWALLHWLYPEVFTDRTSELFKHAFNLSLGKVSTSFIDDARRLLELVMLRRMKNSPGVNLGLPEKEEILLYVPLTPMQRFWYTRLLTRAGEALLDDVFKGAKDKESQTLQLDTEEERKVSMLAEAQENIENSDSADVWAESKDIMHQALANEQNDSKTTDWKRLMNLIMQLRKCCSHPYLLPNAAPSPYRLGDHIRTASGKFIVLDKLIHELVLSQRKKIIIFSGFTETLNLCEDLLALNGGNTHNAAFRYHRLDGGVQRAKRNLGIRMFNDLKSEFKVMLISTRAGGLGINLASASDVVFMDEDWNPQITLQAEARAHRIGQTQKVTIYKLCTAGTVEQGMLGRIRKKLYLSAKITESMRNQYAVQDEPGNKRKRGPNTPAVDNDAPQLGTSQLKSLIRRGAQTLSGPAADVTEMLQWDWNTTLANCKDKFEDVHVAGKTGENAEGDEEKWLNTMERVECAVFEGKRMQRKVDETVKADHEPNRADRRIGKNMTVMVDGYAINKESLGCADWEAVPTFAGKDPTLRQAKRAKKAAIVNQEHCQVCQDGGEIVCCSGCPRSYHIGCLDAEFKTKAKARVGHFYCPQHQCVECNAKAGDAGGLIYRCRWCQNGYCEDCLDWETVRLLGETLKEYEVLGCGRVDQAWYVECPACIEHWKGDKRDEKRCEKERKRIDKMYAKVVAEQDAMEVTEEKAEAPAAIETVKQEMLDVMDVDVDEEMVEATSYELPTPPEELPTQQKKARATKRSRGEASSFNGLKKASSRRS